MSQEQTMSSTSSSTKTVVIGGAGPCGLLLAIKLLERPNYNIHIVEKRNDFSKIDMCNQRTFPMASLESARESAESQRLELLHLQESWESHQASLDDCELKLPFFKMMNNQSNKLPSNSDNFLNFQNLYILSISSDDPATMFFL